MLVRWMRQVRKLRPWMVAVALAGGGAFASCDSGGDDDRDATADVPADTAGDAAADCTPATFYGPATCTSDTQCIVNYGPGWYCDPTPLTYDDGCGHTVEWGRICREGTAADADADVPDVVEDVPADVSDDVPSDFTAYYGPPPADGGPDAADDTPAAYYGPAPADGGGDAADDTPAAYYGPAPVDGGTEDGEPPMLYGPMPSDAGSDDSGPATFYGPMPVDGG